MRTLPSLTALHAFEVAARRLSVRAAADELLVTPGAVSRQIKLLEEHFGVALIERAGRGIALTAKGRAYHEAVRRPFEELRKASSVLAAESAKTVISLRSYTTFATRWLLSRLVPFQLAHPDVEVRLSMSSGWFGLDDIDAAIRLGPGDWPGLGAIPLIRNVLSPVCSPSVARDCAGDPAKLADHTLLATPHRPDDWAIWLGAAGLGGCERFRFLSFESSALAYQAAAASQGIALAQLDLVDTDVRSGLLVRPYELTVDRGGHTYHLVWDAGSPKADVVRRLGESLTAFADTAGA
ncbi:LysR substrate-binding domain-containing protein [Azospirillum sp. ST 5-10]|uniref:LysR substrate-binding domain-containing protein n=1 Tax=unclassified Azospirillum TaxID=2630922 RepID=UPI003F4A2E7F